jgi:hypothetical protein
MKGMTVIQKLFAISIAESLPVDLYIKKHGANKNGKKQGNNEYRIQLWAHPRVNALQQVVRHGHGISFSFLLQIPFGMIVRF